MVSAVEFPYICRCYPGRALECSRAHITELKCVAKLRLYRVVIKLSVDRPYFNKLPTQHPSHYGSSASLSSTVLSDPVIETSNMECLRILGTPHLPWTCWPWDLVQAACIAPMILGLPLLLSHAGCLRFHLHFNVRSIFRMNMGKSVKSIPDDLH